MNRMLKWWVELAYAGLMASYKKPPSNWADRIATLTNLGLGLIVCGVIMKLLLRITGLGSNIYLPLVGLVCLPIMYFFIQNNLGVSVKKVSSYRCDASLDRDGNSLRTIGAAIITLLYPAICLILMIAVMNLI